MSRFNTPIRGTKTTNLAGGEAFFESPKLELVSILLTSFVKDQFYRGADDTIERVVKLMEQLDRKFTAKAAIYARDQFHMRSITHVVAAEIFRMKDGKNPVAGQEWVKNFIDKVVMRPDDMLEILSYFYHKVRANTKAPNPREKGLMPNQLYKGLALATAKFNDYQIAKYQNNDKGLKLVDLLNVVHTKPTDKNGKAIKNLIAGTLKTTNYNAKIANAARSAETEEEKIEAKAEAWADLLKNRKLGYMALVKNLRNILKSAPEMVPTACEMLVDEKLIRNSRMLPFRFADAMKELAKEPGSRDILVALNKALDIACANVPKFPGRTLVALDISSSMQGDLQKNAGLFAAILLKANDADLIRFESSAAYHTVNPMDSTLSIAKEISASMGGTNVNNVFRVANQPYERVIVISDEQSWEGYGVPTADLAAYRQRTGAKPRVFSFDMAGYGTLQFPERDVYAIAGFSEKIFDLMSVLEQDKNALINEIEKVEL